MQDFINLDCLKYAVISKAAYDSDDLAKKISGSPRKVGDDHVLLSISQSKLIDFVDYANTLGFGFEFEFNIDSGRITLLTHEKAKALLSLYDSEVTE